MRQETWKIQNPYFSGQLIFWRASFGKTRPSKDKVRKERFTLWQAAAPSLSIGRPTQGSLLLWISLLFCLHSMSHSIRQSTKSDRRAAGFAGYITRLGDNYLAPVQAAWELAPQHYLDKKTWWLPSHPHLEEILAAQNILTHTPHPMSCHGLQHKGPNPFICCL